MWLQQVTIRLYYYNEGALNNKEFYKLALTGTGATRR